MTGARFIAELPGELNWRKSSHSGLTNCLEAAKLPGSQGVAVRTSHEPEGMALVFSVEEWRAALAGVKAGEFDHLL
jgi:hypothetical protein